jgi:glycosyltransferase involved in cell wall biosynthesis
LFPSLHEGFPKVVIESMACGLPSIVFDRYGPEAVIDNETGFVVSNEEEMIEKLEILIRNKALRDKFSQNAIKRAKEFDWNKIVKQWEDILIKAVENK